jgi:hypothetical protein
MPDVDDLPQNGGYMIAAYIVAPAFYLIYTIALFRRAARVSRGEG